MPANAAGPAIGQRLTAILLAAISCSAAAAQGPVRNTVLKNGLTVITRSVPGAHNVCLAVLYRIGSDQDPVGHSGLAHLVEHAYVTAAAGARKSRTVDAFMKAYPNGWEAQTGTDYTVFATVFPPANLDAELREAADRMSSLHIAASDLEREKPRVLAEVGNMFGGLPSLAAWNLAHERVRPTPGGGRRGGVPEQVQALSVAEVQERWRRYYKPVNAIVVLTGDVPSGAEPAVKKAFGTLPAGDRAPAALAPGHSRLGSVEHIPVKSVVPAATREVCVMAGAPPYSNAEYGAFLVLVSRLQRRYLQIADLPQAVLSQRFPPPVFYALLNDPQVLSLSAPVKAGQSPDTVVRRLKEVIHSAAASELQKDDVAGLRSMFGPILGIGPTADAMWAQNPYGLAFSLARRAQWGMDSVKLDRALDTLTTADLKRAGDAWLAEDRLATVVAEPQ